MSRDDVEKLGHMKVLHVIDTIGIGGAEQMLVNLLTELTRQGHDTKVASLHPPRTPTDALVKDALERGGAEVVILSKHNKWNLLAGAMNIARQGRQTGAEVIHAHLLFPSLYVGLARLLGLTHARTCVTYHNLAYAPGCNKPGPGLWIRRLLNALTSRLGMDGRIAVSQAVADHYRAVLGLGQIDVIPNAIALGGINEVAASIGPALRMADDSLHIVLPGRLVHEKGHSVFIAALSKLLAEGINVRATFAGFGPLRALLEQQVSNANIVDRVTFTGALPHRELLRTIALADIVVVPSLFEGFGMAAAEGMALGRPVIAARTGGLADIISDGKTGLLVKAGDAVELVGAIKRLAADPDLRGRIGRAARAHVEEQFAAQQIASRVSAFYGRLHRI
jgi:glycosyltransferase involved in cell wall biosynthesis